MVSSSCVSRGCRHWAGDECIQANESTDLVEAQPCLSATPTSSRGRSRIQRCDWLCFRCTTSLFLLQRLLPRTHWLEEMSGVQSKGGDAFYALLFSYRPPSLVQDRFCTRPEFVNPLTTSITKSSESVIHLGINSDAS